jgi:hypothetical protein
LAGARAGKASSNADQEDFMTSATQLGAAGLQGWRGKVGDAVAGPVSKRTPLDAEQVQAAVGALFFVLAVVYLVQALREAAQRARG